MKGQIGVNERKSTARVVDCYRCIKQMAFQSNAPMLERTLTTSDGRHDFAHHMVPGGRQGPLVAAQAPKKRMQPPWVTSMTGVTPFKHGSAKHPTQPRLGGRLVAFEEFRGDERGISGSEFGGMRGRALPAGYHAPITREEEAAMLAMRGPILPAEVYAGKGKARGRKPSQKEVAAAIAAELRAHEEMRANPSTKHTQKYVRAQDRAWSLYSKGQVSKAKYQKMCADAQAVFVREQRAWFDAARAKRALLGSDRYDEMGLRANR